MTPEAPAQRRGREFFSTKDFIPNSPLTIPQPFAYDRRAASRPSIHHCQESEQTIASDARTAPLGEAPGLQQPNLPRARAEARFRAFTAWLSALGERNVNCLLLIIAAVAVNMALQWHNMINPDVAFLAWTAKQVLGPPVFGVDIFEINPPLAFMLYSPAALVSPLFGMDLALKLWISALVGLSILCLWNTADRSLRMGVACVLALFATLALPDAFGQRESLAFLLCAPYVAGIAQTRRWGLLSGVMAGVGFSIKPYFLIPLVLVFATRRRLHTEEYAIAATGLLYAASILVFFQPYLFGFLPFAIPSYAAVYVATGNSWQMMGLIALAVLPLGLAGAAQPAARGYLMATLGFLIAAIIQNKGFTYHLIAPWGFMTLFQLARMYNAQTFTAVLASLFLCASLAFFGRALAQWYLDEGKAQATLAMLLPEIDTSSRFLVLNFASFPAFPAALETRSDYVGKSFWPIYLAPALRMTLGQMEDDGGRSMRLALDQALSELARRPDMVIVPVNPRAVRGQVSRDVLSLLSRHPDYDLFWRNYVLAKTLGDYQIYRRRSGAWRDE